MTQPFDDEHGERLRRALHAEAEAVTPSPEGLERIRTKINQRHERRFGFSLAMPWLRPLAAAAAAIVVCVIAVSVTPALANFVQTGHFSPDAGDGTGDSSSTGKTHGQMPPGGPPASNPYNSPSPSSIHTPNTGKHVVNGKCPPGYGTVSPTATPAPSTAPTPSASETTCEPTTGTGTPPPGGDTGAPTPPATSAPAEPPSDQPTSESVPNPNGSP